MLNLTAELKMAMKAGDKPRKAVIVNIKEEVANYKIAKKKDEITDNEMFDLMKKVRKVCLEIMEWKNEAIDKSPTELKQMKAEVKFEHKKVEILNSWLPNKIGDDYLAEMIDEAMSKVEEPSMKQMGFVMSAVKLKVAEANLDVDGKRLSMLVKKALMN